MGGETDSMRPWTQDKSTNDNDNGGSSIAGKSTSWTTSRLEAYANPFMSFLRNNPTVFHAVDYIARRLEAAGFEKLSEREAWGSRLSRGGKFYTERNGSTVIAFTVGKNYEAGNGASVIATHVDAITTRLKPISHLPTKAGYVQLGVAPYAGGLNGTWWDRDLGIGGRVLVRNAATGKIERRLVKLDWPIARIPTLAPHFGLPANLSGANKETQMVPVVGLDFSGSSYSTPPSSIPSLPPGAADSVLGGQGAFTASQPPGLVKAIAGALGVSNHGNIISWDLELFDTQPAQRGGLEKEFIFAGRIDDKLCTYSAVEALLSADPDSCPNSLKILACFDDEEIGSMLRQGAKSNILPLTMERICECFRSSISSFSYSSSTPSASSIDDIGRMYANSFLVSADVCHAVNPNFLEVYLAHHAPRLNVGVALQTDPNGNDPSDGISEAFLQRCADHANANAAASTTNMTSTTTSNSSSNSPLRPAVLQVFQIRNDSRSGSTVGPMLSSATGMRAVDAGMPQLSMHSIRATTGSLDPGLGVQLFKAFFEEFESVDEEFR